MNHVSNKHVDAWLQAKEFPYVGGLLPVNAVRPPFMRWPQTFPANLSLNPVKGGASVISGVFVQLDQRLLPLSHFIWQHSSPDNNAGSVRLADICKTLPEKNYGRSSPVEYVISNLHRKTGTVLATRNQYSLFVKVGNGALAYTFSLSAKLRVSLHSVH